MANTDNTPGKYSRFGLAGVQSTNNVASWLDSADNEETWSNAESVISNPALNTGGLKVGEIGSYGAASKGHLDSYNILDFTREHFKPFVNPYKETLFWIGSPSSKYSEDTGNNWHDASCNGTCNVSRAIRLYGDNEKFAASYSLGLGDASDTTVGGVGGVLDKLSNAVEMAQATDITHAPGAIKHTSAYLKPKIYQNVKPIALDGEVKFNFHFGQAGIFSGLEEVVKPVMALAGIFAPASSSDVPYPTQAQYSAMYLSGVVKAIKDHIGSNLTGLDDAVGGDLFDTSTPQPPAEEPEESTERDHWSSASDRREEEESEGTREAPTPAITTASAVAQAAIEVQNAVFNALHQGAEDAVSSGEWRGYRFCFFQWGNFKVGPCTVGKVAWSFDMSQTDEEGWPISGTVSFSEVQTYKNAMLSAVQNTAFSN